MVVGDVEGRMPPETMFSATWRLDRKTDRLTSTITARLSIIRTRRLSFQFFSLFFGGGCPGLTFDPWRRHRYNIGSGLVCGSEVRGQQLFSFQFIFILVLVFI